MKAVRRFTMVATCHLAASSSVVDPLWLRYPIVKDPQRLHEYRTQIASVAIREETVIDRGTTGQASQAQLRSAASELRRGLSGLLGRDVSTSCCNGGSGGSTELVVSVRQSFSDRLGSEGYRIGRSSAGAVTIEAGTSSGALYGSFGLLRTLQRGDAIPSNLSSIPAMALRVWDLWDNLDGTIERGYAGASFVWPMALFDDSAPPPRKQVYLADCDSTDVFQQWDGDTFRKSGASSTIINRGNGECLASQPAQNPMETAACTADSSMWFYNHSNLSVSAEGEGRCVDVQNGEGPDIDIWHCKSPPDSRAAVKDAQKQAFIFNQSSGQIRTLPSVAGGQCLTLLRSWPADKSVPGGLELWEGKYRQRFQQMMRLLKSSGLNGISLTNVNSCGNNVRIFESALLRNITRNLGPLMRAWGITPYFSACFAAPFELDNISSSPANPEAQRWWAKKVLEIHQLMPEFGGFVVKADAEGNQGPQAFNLTEADGANLIARALKPVGGIVMWRAFVYGDFKEERAKQAYTTFLPIDGHFDENVVVQIKNGPMDFQVREPISPLIAGGLRKTNIMMEVQAAQEYTGQQIHAVGLTNQWETYLRFDTFVNGVGSPVSSLLSGRPMGGLACVSNFGSWANVTGHVFAASNTYGCGRLAWDPTLSASDINREWAAMTFSDVAVSVREKAIVVDTVTSILDRGWLAFEGYTSPLGIGFMCSGCYGWPEENGCAPKTNGPGPGPDGGECPMSKKPDEFHPWGHPGGLENGHQAWHYFVDPCDNYASSNYSTSGIGCDRSSGPPGSSYAAQYTPALRDIFSNVSTCPQELLLFFHNLEWTHSLSLANGSRVQLIDFIAAQHKDALATARQMATDWDALKGLVDQQRFEAVQARFRQQNVDALSFSEVILGYYLNISGRLPGSALHQYRSFYI